MSHNQLLPLADKKIPKVILELSPAPQNLIFSHESQDESSTIGTFIVLVITNRVRSLRMRVKSLSKNGNRIAT